MGFFSSAEEKAKLNKEIERLQKLQQQYLPYIEYAERWKGCIKDCGGLTEGRSQMRQLCRICLLLTEILNTLKKK